MDTVVAEDHAAIKCMEGVLGRISGDIVTRCRHFEVLTRDAAISDNMLCHGQRDVKQDAGQ
ncbi:hypothetical protein ABE502_02505 [Stenotrophomonas sepilia]|uniref:hypothetical protein n=1 Tax=Stenotrophomonas sepilia TaxID=2860290 RepID=UPI003207C9F8